MLCHICKEEMFLTNKKTHYGRTFKEYRCTKGHRKDIERDTGIITIREYISNSVKSTRIILDE